MISLPASAHQAPWLGLMERIKQITPWQYFIKNLTGSQGRRREPVRGIGVLQDCHRKGCSTVDKGPLANAPLACVLAAWLTGCLPGWLCIAKGWHLMETTQDAF